MWLPIWCRFIPEFCRLPFAFAQSLGPLSELYGFAAVAFAGLWFRENAALRLSPKRGISNSKLS
jgi:hypothetical protein